MYTILLLSPSNKSLFLQQIRFGSSKEVVVITFQILVTQGDEVSCLGELYMCFIWMSDLTPLRSNSAASRWPIAIVPASLYWKDPSGINMTVGAMTDEIMKSFNELSDEGATVREFQSVGGEIVPFLHQPKLYQNRFRISLCLFLNNSSFFPHSLMVSLGVSYKVATLRFFVLGVRGDWKAIVQVMNLAQHYNCNKDLAVSKPMVTFERFHQGIPAILAAMFNGLFVIQQEIMGVFSKNKTTYMANEDC